LKQAQQKPSRFFSCVRQWMLIWFVPVYLGVILALGWFDQWEAANFCQWFLLICLAVWDLFERLRCGSIPTGKRSHFSPSLLDRLTFMECGLTLWLGCLLPVPVWIIALGVGIGFYHLN